MSANLVVGDDGSNVLNGTAGSDLIYGYNPNGAQATTNSITGTRVATGLNQPLFVTAPPGDTARLFIVEKTGLIKVLDLATGQVLPTPFLDVSSQILTAGEQGLLGLAFDPNFAQNRYIYVNLINSSGDTEVRRYQVSAGNSNVVDSASNTLIITIDQPNASNHKAGWLGFGPDGYLYIASGDGGGGGDTFHNGQNMENLLGKIVRIDVNSDAFPGDPTRNYAVPADNPFVGVAGADEIWALGLRNPWRSSFDRGLGDFYIADVGQSAWEEVNFGVIGANYGWNAYEGPAAFPGGDPVSGGTLTFPIHSYSHAVGQSITGGYVYRGPSEGLHGQYFFADFVQGKVWTLALVGGSWIATERTSQIAYDFGTLNNPASFGQDALGNLYVVDFDGDIFRLTPNVTSADLGDTINGMGGHDLIFGGSGGDTISGGDGNDELQGGNGGDMLSGDSGSDLLSGEAGADTINGGADSDKLIGGGGNDTIDGGGGNADTAVYGGSKSQYQITKHPDGTTRLVDLRSGSPDGTDTVSNVEFFQFADGTFSLNSAPVVTVPNATVQAASTAAIAMSSLFSAADEDFDTLAYLFYDSTVGGGRIHVNGVAQPEGNGQFFAVSASQISQVSFVAGAGSSDDLLIGATDSKSFSGWSSLHINGPVNHVPVVTVPNAAVQAASTAAIALSGLFSASDSDGDTLAYLFYDSSVGGGRIHVNGVPQPEGNGQFFAVPAAQLSQVTFVPGAGSADDLSIGATDGKSFSGWSNLHINGPVNHVPVVTVPNATVQAGSTAAVMLSGLFSASDSDGDTLAYLFYDSSVGGGRIYVNGVLQPEGNGQFFAVPAAQLSQVTFVPGAGTSDDLSIGATDGKSFSGWSSLHINGPVNHAPVVTVPNPIVQATSGVALSSLVSASDADGDTLAYLFYDSTVGGGRIHVNGVAQPEGNGQFFAVAAAQLSQVTFVPGAGSSDDLSIGATDGKIFSGWSSLHINGPVNHAPVVTVPNSTVPANAGDTLQLSDLVSASDADGDTLAYVFYDGTAGGGHFEVGGVAQPSNTIFGVAASQLSQLVFVAGPGADDLLVGATDNKTFSGWSDLHVV